MRLGIFAKTFPGSDPAAVMAQVRSAGFASAQYNMACSGLAAMPDAITDEQAVAVRDAAETCSVDLCAVSGTYNMAHPDPAVREAGLRRLDVLAGAAGAMGTTLITLCTGTCDPDDQWRHHPDNAKPETWAVMRGEMAKAALIAERFGVRLGIEPELANVVDSAASARRLIDELGSPALSIVLDAANLFETATLQEQRSIVAESIDLLADRIVMAHAKDRLADGSFVTAGKGVLDYPHYIACLRATGFSGDLVTHGLSAAEAPVVARFLSDLLA